MKKVIALFAFSFFLVSANYAQTGTRSTDTTTSHKMMKKNMNKGKRSMDSTRRGNGSLTPMNNGSGRADSTNTNNGMNNGTMMPNQSPAQMPNQTPANAPIPTTPAPVPNK